MSKIKKQVIPQMFDVKPLNKEGNLDVKKIESLPKIIRITSKRYHPAVSKKIGDVFHDIRQPTIEEEEALRFRKILENNNQEKTFENYQVSIKNKEEYQRKIPVNIYSSPSHSNYSSNYTEEKSFDRLLLKNQETDYFSKFQSVDRDKRKRRKNKDWQSIFWKQDLSTKDLLGGYRPALTSFTALALIIVLIFSSLNLGARGFKIKGVALTSSEKAYANLIEAKTQITKKNFRGAQEEFQEAYEQFNDISRDINSLGKIVVEASQYVPYLSKLFAGSHLTEAGKNISEVGVKIAITLETLNKINNPLIGENNNQETASLLQVFQETDKNFEEISQLLQETQSHLSEVKLEDIPENQRSKFVELKEKLPFINQSLTGFLSDSKVFSDILGGNGPRKYLFLLQNNHEMRATGGFIGSYALLDISNGRVRNFFIDGIFNPDGQLRERIVPPAPIQKISANWSLHDSNWFPDFPTSAEKAMWFYEKTGGPTVDGVITVTPVVLQKLLAITGPIELEEYGITVDENNFMETIQYEVEVEYDRQENKPKKVLADLAPRILDRIFNAKDVNSLAKTVKILMDSINEKHVLIYAKNYEIQKILSERGWTGEILNTNKDYLSVINTNINGFKSDGVVEETINHQAEIQKDGSVIDTVTITRKHQGGYSDYEWWNKVNADYMRVYVPQGSQLLSASGQTREFNVSPLDYDALGYKRDPQVKMEEDSMIVDEKSGTRIYEEKGKTVFANWVYVSPQEKVEIKYVYLLPFKLSFEEAGKDLVSTYSLLAQKQSGSNGSNFSSQIFLPQEYKLKWSYPENSSTNQVNNQVEMLTKTKLKTDKFIGAAFINYY